jgi:hypothetical protein
VINRTFELQPRLPNHAPCNHHMKRRPSTFIL